MTVHSIEVATRSHQGYVRKRNQDSLSIDSDLGQYFEALLVATTLIHGGLTLPKSFLPQVGHIYLEDF